MAFIFSLIKVFVITLCIIGEIILIIDFISDFFI